MLTVCVLVIVAVNLLFEGLSDLFSGYDSPSIAVMSILLFSIIKELTMPKIWLNKLWTMDRLCFEVYLVHPVFTNLFYKVLNLSPLIFGKWIPIGILFFWVIFTICGFVSAKIISMIRPLKKYVLGNN